jgi:hypothetical protein
LGHDWGRNHWDGETPEPVAPGIVAVATEDGAIDLGVGVVLGLGSMAAEGVDLDLEVGSVPSFGRKKSCKPSERP